MITTDFATNESWDDAWLSLMLLFQPCKWKSGKETQLLKDQPEFALLLTWNMKDIIIPKLKNKGFNGKIIVPIPKPHLL